MDEYQSLARANGVFVIGATPNTISIASVADAGNGQIEITTSADHGLVNKQGVSISGTTHYDSDFRVDKIVSSTKFLITATFVATATGTIALTYAEGRFMGFKVLKLDTGSITIGTMEFEPEARVSIAAVKDRPFNVGDVIWAPITKMKVTAGDVELIRKPDRGGSYPA